MNDEFILEYIRTWIFTSWMLGMSNELIKESSEFLIEEYKKTENKEEFHKRYNCTRTKRLVSSLPTEEVQHFYDTMLPIMNALEVLEEEGSVGQYP